MKNEHDLTKSATIGIPVPEWLFNEFEVGDKFVVAAVNRETVFITLKRIEPSPEPDKMEKK